MKYPSFPLLRCVSTNLSDFFSPLTHALPAQSWGLKTNRN